jgi:uncharacterized damage-inducible protein DinB
VIVLTYLRRLFEQIFWADARVLALLRTVEHERSLRLLAHLLAAERVWLTRLRGEDSSRLEIWPTLSLAECETLAAESRAGYTAYLEGLSERDLPEPVTYRNSTGAAFHTARLDILTHVALHGSYHRGQIAQLVRGAGAEPVNTDYIIWVREQG